MGAIAQGRSDQMSTLRVADMDQASNRTLHGRKSEEEIMSDAELVFTCADLSRDLMMPVHEVRKILRRLKVPSSSQYLIVNCGYSVDRYQWNLRDYRTVMQAIAASRKPKANRHGRSYQRRLVKG